MRRSLIASTGRLPRPRSAAIAILFGALITGAVLVLLLGFLPDRMVLQSPTPEELGRSRAVNEARQTMAQIVAGVVVIIGGGVTAWLTLRRVNAVEQQLALQVQGDVTDRLSRGIEQLGASSDAGPTAEIRAGAVFTLERVATESDASFGPVFQILMGYLRTHSPRLPEGENATPPPLRAQLRMDVGAAFLAFERLLPRRAETSDDSRVVLPQTHYPRANLSGADLSLANLTGAEVREAYLSDANLSGANLSWAKLIGAQLIEANLSGANLRLADLLGANLNRANLNLANLIGADLRRADLIGANLRRADLSGATLSGAKLTDVEYDETTIWPDGFTPPPSTPRLPDAVSFPAEEPP